MLRKLFAGSLLVAVAAACGDSTGPEDFNPASTQAQAEAVLAAFNNNAALLSIMAIPSLPFGTPAALATVPSSPTDPTLTPRLQALGSRLLSLGAASPLALFPVDVLGNTYIYNIDTHQYVEDPQRTGAPSDGVRLILYAVDPILHTPLEPLQEIGYLDLRDVSSPSADAIRIIAVVNGTTYLDYIASAVVGTTTATLSAVGYVSDGSHRVDFDLSFEVTSSQISIGYLLESGGNSVHLVVYLTESGETIWLTVSDGENTVILHVVATATSVQGDIRYNGDVAITISGTPDNPTFLRWDGTELTASEIQALQNLVIVIGGLLDSFDNLLAPALLVFIIGTAA